MKGPWLLFLMLILVSFGVQAFYSMMEMACVSFNRVRLEYYVSQKNRRARWLSFLLSRPTYLFGTTLIGVNGALQFGSECARRFYAALGLSPNWSPLSQVLLVLIFAELAPMFAARRFAESVVMLGMPFLYATAVVMRPITWVLDLVYRLTYRLFSKGDQSRSYLSREELQRAIEERADAPIQIQRQQSDPVLMHLFSLKNKQAKDLMHPLNHIDSIGSESQVSDLRRLLGLQARSFIPVYHRVQSNIVAIAYPRDLIRLSDETRLRPYCRNPWFVTEKNSILEIIKEFRRNREKLACVLDNQGNTTGILTLDAIVDEIFGGRSQWMYDDELTPEKHHILIDRSFPGETTVAFIQKALGIVLSDDPEETLEELMARHLNHRPEEGETIHLRDVELSMEKSSLLHGKTIALRSLSHSDQQRMR